MENSGLFLSICSIGCLFLGTQEAALYGTVLFERLLKSLMASVFNLMSILHTIGTDQNVQCDVIEGRHKHEIVPMVQLALIGQMFGILSGVSGQGLVRRDPFSQSEAGTSSSCGRIGIPWYFNLSKSDTTCQHYCPLKSSLVGAESRPLQPRVREPESSKPFSRSTG